MKISYVTSNAGKFEEACHVLHDWTLEQVPLDLQEIQGSASEIVVAKAYEALSILKRPLIVEDISFYLHAIGGLPGPYAKDFLTTLGEQGAYELVHKYDDHSATCVCLAAYIEPEQEPVVFKGETRGTIVAPRGNLRHGAVSFNSIFLPENCTHTFGEMSMEEHARFSMRYIALIQLKEYLLKKHP
jgi:inosine triphosphate pyrophosphatase